MLKKIKVVSPKCPLAVKIVSKLRFRMHEILAREIFASLGPIKLEEARKQLSRVDFVLAQAQIGT